MATNGDSRVSVFARYIDSPEQEPSPPPVPLATPPEALRLLNWLQHNWGRDTICAKNLYQFGPHPIRKRVDALKAAEVLEKRGWLIPIKTSRRDGKRWQVTIGPA
jgi:hypothetical protein